MTTAEMNTVEKVARILQPASFKSYESLRDYCLQAGDDEAAAKRTAEWAHGHEVKRAMQMARAAIEALREPTTNMVLKGLVRSERDDIELTLEEVEEIWRAMIDDALTTN